MPNNQEMMLDLATRLADVAVKNTASGINNKIKAVKANRDNKKTIAELEEIINDLLLDRNELIQIGQTYEEEFVMQKISEEDIEYITNNLIPVIKELVLKTTEFGEDESVINDKIKEMENIIEVFKPILSIETFTILQLLGFNFRRAVGEPLTELLRSIILSKTINDTDDGIKKFITPEMVEVLKNDKACTNLFKIMEVFN